MIAKVGKKFANRIDSLRGETLVETLAAILVASLAMIMLANTIGIAQNIIGKGREAANSHYDAETVLAASVGIPSKASVRLETVDGKTYDDSSESIDVLRREAEVPGGYTVVSYETLPGE